MKKFLIIIILFPFLTEAQTIYINGVGRTASINSGQPSSITINDFGNTVFLYILAGQSNVGRARTSSMTAQQQAAYQGLIPNTKIFNPYLSTTLLYDLNVGTNTMLRNANFTNEFGCEASLLRRRPGNKCLLKFGVGSTTMQGNWNSIQNRPLWQDLLAYTNTVVAALIADGKVPILKAFIWMQGEGDATSDSFSANYYMRLQAFFDDYKTFWDGIIAANSLPAHTYTVVVGRINGPDLVYRAGVRQAAVDFCAIPGNNAVMIDTDSYPLEADNVHYTAAGQIQFGIDILNAID